MNSEYPPIQISQPHISARRRERLPFPRLPPVAVSERTTKCHTLRTELREIATVVRQLTPEQRRAAFLKLTHDRPLTKLDLRGTGLMPMGPSTSTETLVVPKKKSLETLEERLGKIAADTVSERPTGVEFVTRISSIAVADPKARLSPEFAADYESLIHQEFVVYEIEVASFATRLETRRREVERSLTELREFLGAIDGRIYETDFAGVGARAVLSSTGEKLKALVEDPRWWRQIVLFEKRPHFETFETVYQSFSVSNTTLSTPPDDAETICVIDTGVAGANPFLQPVLRTQISHSFIDGFAPDADGVGHGSGVASLAAYYQIDMSHGSANSASAFVASARITNDAGELDTPYIDDDGVQRLREARLLSRILRDVVAHFRPNGVRIFVLSFSIVGHIWNQAGGNLVPRNSWVARTVDQLSRDFDVVFVAITGNLSPADVEDLSANQQYPLYLRQALAKILDPGQAALAVTVGSLAPSERVIVAPSVPIARENQPSPFTRTGPGFGQAVKPDFVERGGNLVRDPQQRVASNAGTNVVMASNKLTPPLQHGNGNSYAGPRVANQLASIVRDLRPLIAQPSAPLLRAFLALSAEAPTDPVFARAEDLLKCVGYGLPIASRATDCAPHSVILFYDGAILVDRVGLFRIPVPVEIRDSENGLKRITIAVASAPPVQQWGVAEYLGARLKFRLFRGDKPTDQIVSMMQRNDDEENLTSDVQVDHLPGKLKIQRRSVGTLQRDVFEWHDHESEFSANDYILAVSLSAASWCKDTTSVPLGLAVRLEDTTGRCQRLYSQVQARVLAQVQLQSRVRA